MDVMKKVPVREQDPKVRATNFEEVCYGYNEEEVEEFREIMYTCKEDEVAGWSRSLQLRGIELPDELKDELFLIVGERRFK